MHPTAQYKPQHSFTHEYCIAGNIRERFILANLAN